MVSKLEAEGLVECREHKHGAREILVSTTAKGSAAYQQAAQQSLFHLKDTLGILEPEQLAAIRTLLSTLDAPQRSEQESDVERLYAIAPVGLCYFDTNLRFLYINEWLARINGLPVAAHLGKPIDEVIEDVAVSVVPQLRQVLETGEPIVGGKVEAETPAHPGESRQYMHNYYPDRSEDGTVVGVSCVVHDITERTQPDLDPAT
jgi:PAS domain S-box-containing protein